MPNISPNQVEFTRRVFHDQVEWFIKKHAPANEKGYEHWEFIADFCLVIRDLGIQGQEAYCDVATKAMKDFHNLVARMPLSPAIIKKDD